VFLLLAGAVIAQATGASSNEDMKQRLTRARAFVAVRSYTAAAFELEKIRKESTDPSVQNIALTLLMNCYLENGDYKHTQDLLNETFTFVKTAKGNSSSSYFTISGQLLRMARAQLERYKQLGLNIADPDIPTEVAAEIEKMRGTLELVVTQTKELSDSNKRSAEAFGLLEEVTNTRSSMARDAYDATRWKNEVADARERLANSQSLVVNVVDEPANSAANVAQNTGTANTTPVVLNTSNPTPPIAPIDTNAKPQANPGSNAARDILKESKPQTSEPVPNVADDQKAKANTPGNTNGNTAANTPPTNSTAANLTPNVSDAGGDKPKTRARTSGEKNSQTDPAQSAAGVKSDPLATSTSVGSLVDMATKKVAPVYPQIARNMRVGGVVRVDLVVDEQGAVLSAQAVQGPEMLKRAAMDAVKQWKFKPVMIDGQATKASGFINFNFSL
jgi:TonB family protein